MTIYQKIFSYLAIGLIIFLLARIGLLLVHFENFQSLSFQEILIGFLNGFRFDLASLFVFLGIPFILLALPFQWTQKVWWHAPLSLFIYFILLIQGSLLISDIVYFSYVKRHITNELLFLAEDVDYIIKEILANPGFMVVWLGLIGLSLYYWSKLIRVKLKPIRMKWIKFVLLIILIGIIGRGGVGMKPLAIVHAFSHGNTELGNLILNGVFSASHSSISSKERERQPLSKTDTVKILNFKKDFWQNPYPLSQKFESQPAKRPNIVFLFIESLTPKYVDNFGGNDYGITPNLDRLSREGWKFERFYAHGQRSIEGAQSVLTGLPTIQGVPDITSLSVKYTKLAKLAEANGVSTLFVNSTLQESFLFHMIAGAVGFSEYYSKEDMPILLDYAENEKDRDLGWDYETLMFTLQKLDSQKSPFLSFISLSTDHTPFPKLMQPFDRFEHGKNKIGGYLNALNYTDWAIGEFVKEAEKKAWFDNTIFIITSDHALAHFQSGNFLDRFWIPLIFYSPKLLEPKIIKKIGYQLDILPTLVEMQKLNGNFTAFGSSLMQDKESVALIKEGSLIGIITDQGYLRHSLMQRLEFKSFQENVPEDYFDALEKKLLAWDRLGFDLIKENRWAP